MTDQGPSETIRISATYYNIVADFLGRRHEDRVMPASTTLRDLLAALGGESAPFSTLAFTPKGKVSGYVRVFCNGQAVLDPNQILADGDEIRLFPSISGG